MPGGQGQFGGVWRTLFFGLVSTVAALSLAVPGAAQVDNSVRTPQPMTDPDGWITARDYPDLAAGRDESVTVSLRVDERGQVMECWVRQSADYQPFNTLTCQLLTKRARFRPARDAAGAAVIGDYRHTVHWAPPPGYAPGGVGLRIGN